MDTVIVGVVMGVHKIWLTRIAHSIHQFTGEVGEFFRRHSASFHRCRHMKLEACGPGVTVCSGVIFQVTFDLDGGLETEAM